MTAEQFQGDGSAPSEREADQETQTLDEIARDMAAERSDQEAAADTREWTLTCENYVWHAKPAGAGHRYVKNAPGFAVVPKSELLRARATHSTVSEEQVERAYQHAIKPGGSLNQAWGIVQGMKPDVREPYELAFRQQVRDLLAAALSTHEVEQP